MSVRVVRTESELLAKAKHAQAAMQKALEPGELVTIEQGRAWRDIADLVVLLIAEREREGAMSPHNPPAPVDEGEREWVAHIVDAWAMESESRDILTRSSREEALAKADKILAPYRAKLKAGEEERERLAGALKSANAKLKAYEDAYHAADIRAEALAAEVGRLKEVLGTVRDYVEDVRHGNAIYPNANQPVALKKQALDDLKVIDAALTDGGGG